MIQSMTGYGKAEVQLDGGKMSIEIRTLNGKSAEINLKSSLLPRDKELELRNRIATTLRRGTIDVFINWEPNSADTAKSLNIELVTEYYNKLTALRDRLSDSCKAENAGLMDNELFTAVLRFPDVLDNRKQEIITESNWEEVSKGFDKALAAVVEYRRQEGVSLYDDVTSRVKNILGIYTEVEAFEPERIVAVRSKIEKGIADLQLKPDKERFEQEIVFYLEKLDINEEKVRLRQHCKYFMDTIDNDPFPGKKLGFIVQEMGREINTTGSKANHAGIQKCVVRMKDELEKVREQSMNIL